ncbi:hypothetical protein EBO15_29625 [Actinomadura harenae]|uniref:Uncharacterized protein n=2 Tax=Actinomadura harenae TaxID=2483351 RepID=A0A3M2LS85_9ACTN|nr:hypothetical protein EBO15_29625 [Actinomadura harenae]
MVALMSDPMTIAIATAMAGKAVEVAGEPAKEAVAGIVRRVRDRFRGRSDEVVLTAAAANPDSMTHMDEFALALRRLMTEDPAFRAELEVLWNQVETSSTVQHGGVVNNFHGQAEKVIMTGDIDGGLTIN